MRGEKQDASEQEDDGRTGRRAFRGLLWPIDGTQGCRARGGAGSGTRGGSRRKGSIGL